jgi:hypothetical protein
MKRIIALFVLALSLAASARAATPTPVFYICDRAEANDFTALHYCNEFTFALDENRSRYQLHWDGFRVRISSHIPKYAPEGATIINVNFTHTVPGQTTEEFIDSAMFEVVVRPGADNTVKMAAATLGRLDLAVHKWNLAHPSSR